VRVARYDREIAEGRVADALVTAMKITAMGPRLFGLVPHPILARLTASMLAKEDRSSPPDRVTMRALAPTLHHDFAAVLDASRRIEQLRGIRAGILLLGGSRSPAYLRRALDRGGVAVGRCGEIAPAVVLEARVEQLPGRPGIGRQRGGRQRRHDSGKRTERTIFSLTRSAGPAGRKGAGDSEATPVPSPHADRSIH
jgi:hypothetical protein